MRWGKVDGLSLSKGMYQLNSAVPEMSLREVDEVLQWMRDELGGRRWSGGEKKLWGRLKKRQEELLGREPGSGLPKQGKVRVLTAEQAQMLDEVRALRREVRELREERKG